MFQVNILFEISRKMRSVKKITKNNQDDEEPQVYKKQEV